VSSFLARAERLVRLGLTDPYSIIAEADRADFDREEFGVMVGRLEHLVEDPDARRKAAGLLRVARKLARERTSP
jgi:hypothetical protein